MQRLIALLPFSFFLLAGLVCWLALLSLLLILQSRNYFRTPAFHAAHRLADEERHEYLEGLQRRL